MIYERSKCLTENAPGLGQLAYFCEHPSGVAFWP